MRLSLPVEESVIDAKKPQVRIAQQATGGEVIFMPPVCFVWIITNEIYRGGGVAAGRLKC
jgi:hypothetical protein